MVRREAPSPVPSVRRELCCDCASLLARMRTGEIELKCRRCKRVIIMGPATLGRGWRSLANRCTCALEEDQGAGVSPPTCRTVTTP
jgi:hypothetical protein